MNYMIIFLERFLFKKKIKFFFIKCYDFDAFFFLFFSCMKTSKSTTSTSTNNKIYNFDSHCLVYLFVFFLLFIIVIIIIVIYYCIKE